MLFNLKKRDQKRERENEGPGTKKGAGPKREHPKNLPSEAEADTEDEYYLTQSILLPIEPIKFTWLS